MRTFLVSRGGTTQPNIGLAYVHTALRQAGIDATLVDLTFAPHPEESLHAALRPSLGTDGDAAIVGFSANSVNLGQQLRLARAAKQRWPGILVVFGGVHPTLLPEEMLRNSFVDAVCIGEGELSLVELVQRQLAPTPGIRQRRPDGTADATPLRPFIEDLDALPFPDWSAWDLPRYQHGFLLPAPLWILSSRGCGYGCRFCSNAAIRRAVPGRYERLRSARNIVDEVLHNEARRPLRSVFFESENIVQKDARFLEELAGPWREAGLDRRLLWGCKVRADLVTRDWARLARALGCVFVSIGLESGSERVRHAYGKRISDAAFQRACAALEEQGIVFNLNVLVDTPLETVADVRQSVRFAESLRPATIFYSPYVSLPRTPLGELPRRRHSAAERRRMKREITASVVRENLRLLGRGLAEFRWRFLERLARSTARLLWPPDQSWGRLLASSPVKTAYYDLCFTRALESGRT